MAEAYRDSFAPMCAGTTVPVLRAAALAGERTAGVRVLDVGTGTGGLAAALLETGAEHGMWTFQRYRTWLDNRTNWSIPEQNTEAPDAEPEASPSFSAAPAAEPAVARSQEKKSAPAPVPVKRVPDRIEIEPMESEFGKILKRPGEQ